jgi:pyruvate/2-oxoglutarate dehydrogenase complex dihydrolipoamide acyltransferase (E2) component
MTEGRIVQWLKQPGENVTAGEPVVLIETDKAEVEVNAPTSGVLKQVLVREGDDALVETPIAIFSAGPEEILVPGVSVSSGSAAGPQRLAISPAARRVAREFGVNLTGVAGTGPGGLITERDVRAIGETAALSDDGEVEQRPLVGLRRRIAEHMSLSRRTAADVTTVLDVEMTAAADAHLRRGLSYTSMIAWAAARALREYPVLNATLVDNVLLVRRSVHLGVAVALDDGLVVPVVRSADQKTIQMLQQEIEILAARARAGTLVPDELTGGTFTLTNSGGFGSLLFTPIINTPQVAILGIGRVAEVPVVRDGAVVVGRVMHLCLSYDHRAVDGATAVQFLQVIKGRLERPALIE